MTDPLWERLLVAAIGPTVTVLLALVLVNRVTDRVQARRDANAVREQLAQEMSETANDLYFALQSFRRSARGVDLSARLVDPSLKEARGLMEDAYIRARVRSQSLEMRLRIYFRSPEPAQAWHRVVDLLSTRYFLLLRHTKEERLAVRTRNAGPKHSGLTEEQLNDPGILLREIRRAIPQAVALLWQQDVDRRGRHVAPGTVDNWLGDHQADDTNQNAAEPT